MSAAAEKIGKVVVHAIENALTDDVWEAIRDCQADEERDDVVVFLRRHERDQLLGITPPTIADLIAALERGEHRR